jgi:hypothetical protein
MGIDRHAVIRDPAGVRGVRAGAANIFGSYFEPEGRRYRIQAIGCAMARARNGMWS